MKTIATTIPLKNKNRYKSIFKNDLYALLNTTNMVTRSAAMGKNDHHLRPTI
jgi:hypothetical protein